MSFVEELKRRNVFRVGIAYLITAWLLLQVADLVLENIDAPNWIMQVIMLGLAIGFPIALIIAWAFELTPEGLKKEREVDRSESITHTTGRKLDRAIIVVLAVALGYFVWDKFMVPAAPPPNDGEAAIEVVEEGITETDTPSIAVLPFANRSSREEDAFFADGIHDDLLTSLAKIGSLKVISRTSVMRYRESDLSIPEIAAELGVTTILEGGIQRSADQVRVNVQLIDAGTDEHLWAENYDRALTAENLFNIQSEISREIVTALHGALTDTESAQLAEQPTDSLEAYGEFVLGRQQMALRTNESLVQAQQHFEKAIELDPEYTLAYVGLADAISLQANYGDLFINDTFEPRQVALDRALALNPNSGEAWTSLANLRDDQDQDDAAEDFFKKAIELSPNYATTYHWYSLLLRELDRNEEALKLSYKAHELDPNAPIIANLLSGALWDVERREEALQVNWDQLMKTPDFPNLYTQRSAYYFMMGELGKSALWTKAYAELDASHSYAAVQVCNIHVQLGAAEVARQCYDRAEEAYPEASFGARIILHQLTGDYAKSLAVMEQIAERFPFEGPQVGLGYNLILNGKLPEALELIERNWPDLLGTDLVEVTEINDNRVNLAGMVLFLTGSQDRAKMLLNEVLAFEANQPRPGLAPVFIYALLDDRERAIESLKQAMDSGWRGNWFRLRYPMFDAMLEEPEWVDLITELEADIAAQRRWFEANKDTPVLQAASL